MKKLFWIPLFVILTVIPMIAGAAPVAGEPVAGNATSPTATSAPKYALKGAGAGDEKTATAGYVKGAYNAVIKGINSTQDEIDTLNTGIETYSDAIGQLTTGKATKDGTVATIKNATTTESIATSSVNFTGVTTTSISATASGNVNLSVPIVDDWETDSLAENPIETTASFSGLTVDNLTMSAPTTNTATLTKTGITGNVDVSGYLTSAYTRLEYIESTGTQWIDTGITPTADFDFYLDGMITSNEKRATFGTSDGSISSRVYSDTLLNSIISSQTINGGIDFGGANNRFYIGLSPHRILNFDGTVRALERTYSSSGTFWLLKNNEAYNHGLAKARIYGAKLYDGSTLVFNLIPSKRISDNAIGMYDTVTGNFLTNAGTGEFVAGPVIDGE